MPTEKGGWSGPRAPWTVQDFQVRDLEYAHGTPARCPGCRKLIRAGDEVRWHIRRGSQSLWHASCEARKARTA